MTTRIRFAIWSTIAAVLAVALTGVVALGTIDSSFIRYVDTRLQVATGELPNGADGACERIEGSADRRDRVVVVIGRDGTERCRSSGAAISARAFGLTDPSAIPERAHTVEVEGEAWRLSTRVLADRSVVVAAEPMGSRLAARRDAQGAVFAAMGAGVALAAIVGALVSIPATRRIARLLDRIRAAGDDRTGRERVGRIGGRDLDAAATSFDELLERLRRADAAQRRLFADVAHELRTPVTSIKTNAQLLERSPSLDVEARDIAERISRQATVISDLVVGLVDHVAVDAWVDRARGPVALGSIVDAVVDATRRRWPDATIVVAHDDGSAFGVDPDFVARAVANLIDNAVVHGRGEIRVDVRDCTIGVEDDGPGLPDALAEDPFRPFASGGGGSGLGLAFVDHVARAHGGSAVVARVRPLRIELAFSPKSQIALGPR